MTPNVFEALQFAIALNLWIIIPIVGYMVYKIIQIVFEPIDRIVNDWLDE